MPIGGPSGEPRVAKRAIKMYPKINETEKVKKKMF